MKTITNVNLWSPRTFQTSDFDTQAERLQSEPDPSNFEGIGQFDFRESLPHDFTVSQCASVVNRNPLFLMSQDQRKVNIHNVRDWLLIDTQGQIPYTRGH